MKKLFFYGLMLLTASFTFVACSNDDDDDDKGSLGISDSQAKEAPEVSENTISIPNFSAPYIEEGSNGTVGNISFTGIKGVNGNYLNLVGTDGGANQNIWLSIDGQPKAIKIVNAGKNTKTKPAADVVFLIDDSGSMDQEADSIAAQVVEWSKVLASVVDARFGCVGYGDSYYGIDGALDLNDVSVLDEYLNMNNKSGTYRTQGFYGDNAEKFQELTQSSTNGYYNSSYNECGVLALHFADEQFSFRDGANRIYLNFTDEPNQPANYKQWSVETLNSGSDLYNWSADKGTVHSIYSESDTEDYEGPNGYYYRDNQQSPYGWSEKPWAMSEYTGGTTIFAPYNFKGVTLNGIEVTGAITNTYVMRFNITPDLKTGVHTLVITVLDKNGQAVKQSSMTFTL